MGPPSRSDHRIDTKRFLAFVFKNPWSQKYCTWRCVTGTLEKPPKTKMNAKRWALAYGKSARMKFPDLPWRKGNDYKEHLKLFEYPIAGRLRGSAKGVAIAVMWAAEQARSAESSPFFRFTLDLENPLRLILIRKGHPIKCPKVKRGLAAIEGKLKTIVDELRQLEQSMIAPFDRPSALIEGVMWQIRDVRRWLSEMHPEWKLARADRAFHRDADTLGQVNCMAYVLDRLLRNYAEPKMKVKEIEDLIANFENSHLGQNIAHDERFGSEAVRQQVHKYKKDPEKVLVDAHIEKFLNSEEFGDAIDDADWARSMLPHLRKAPQTKVVCNGS